MTADRCAAAHDEDLRPCEGSPRAARVVDASGGEVYGCVLHGAALLASLDGGRVHAGDTDGAAIEVFRRAQSLTPFAFGEDDATGSTA